MSNLENKPKFQPPPVSWNGKPSLQSTAQPKQASTAIGAARPTSAPPPVVWAGQPLATAQKKTTQTPPLVTQAQQKAPHSFVQAASRPLTSPPPVLPSGPAHSKTAIQPKLSQVGHQPPSMASAFSVRKAPCCPQHSPPSITGSHPKQTVIQRMTMPSIFPINDKAQKIFQKSMDATQDDLKGNSQSKGKRKFEEFESDDIDSISKNYVTSTTGVYAFLKINGNFVSFGRNKKAGSQLIFEEIGHVNQKGIKDNFHAEDWCIQNFKDSYSNSNKSLRDFLSEKYPNTNNTGTPGKHVFSIRISYSSCLGCTTTIRNFKNWLDAKLGSQNFILRVKFLRPYSVAVTLKNKKTQSASNFISSIGGLQEFQIPVRFQPESSAIKMYKKLKNTDNIAENHQGIDNILNTKQMDYLSKTWTDMGINRKGTPSLLSSTSISTSSITGTGVSMATSSATPFTPQSTVSFTIGATPTVPKTKAKRHFLRRK